jgi:hypothetical protein
MTNRYFHMTRAELDALPEEERKLAEAAINDVVFGDARERRYLQGDYDKSGGSWMNYETGE